MSALRTLADRVEAAAGPDSELDRLIRDTVFGECMNGAADYCSSIDAAMSLASNNAYARGSGLTDDHAYSILVEAMSDCPLDQFTARLPRFVTAAALRALRAPPAASSAPAQAPHSAAHDASGGRGGVAE